MPRRPLAVTWYFALAVAGAYGLEVACVGGGPAHGHVALFAWPRAHVAPLFLSSLLAAACAVAAPLHHPIVTHLAPVVFAAHAPSAPAFAHGAATAHLGAPFAWWAVAHAGAFAAWRDAAHLTAAGRGCAPAATLVFFLSVWLSWWAGCLGALWALTATTPPLLWASDWVELIAALAFIAYASWAHGALSRGLGVAHLAAVFPGSLLAFQAAGAWTFHHEASSAFAAFAACAAAPTPQPLAHISPALAPAVFLAPLAARLAYPLPWRRDGCCPPTWRARPAHWHLHVWVSLALVSLAAPLFCAAPMAAALGVLALASGLARVPAPARASVV